MTRAAEGAAAGADALTKVDALAMNSGIVLARWFANEAERVYAALAESPEEREARWLLETIRARGGRISPRHLDDRFAAYRAAAGLPKELSVHCLRHSYVSHLIEDGVDPLFVQQQVGHSYASTTAVYTTVGADHKNRMLRRALERAFGFVAPGDAGS